MQGSHIIAVTPMHMMLTASAHLSLQVRWRFFDGAQFEIMAFREGETLPDEEWQAPDYCFKQERKWLPQQ